MDSREETKPEYRLFTIKDMTPLFQRSDWGRGRDVGHHIGSPGWIEKSKDHILHALTTIFASDTEGEYHDLYMILSKYMIREERDGSVFNTYKDEDTILTAFKVWHEKGLQETITGHYFHGLGTLNGCIEDIINQTFAKDSDAFLMPDFEECKKRTEEIREWLVNNKQFLECQPLFEYLLDTIARMKLVKMNPETDDCGDTIMHLAALYAHAQAVQTAIKKVREKQST